MQRFYFFLVFLFQVNVHSYAQNPKVGCNDKSIRLQSEQLKQDFIQQGMVAYKDAMIGMDSHQPYPIAVQLTKGLLYQLIFVGDMNASKLEFELFDGEDKKIDGQVLKNPMQKNYLIYSFIPDKSDVYLVTLTQIWKSKSMCGSFTIMQKNNK